MHFTCTHLGTKIYVHVHLPSSRLTVWTLAKTSITSNVQWGDRYPYITVYRFDRIYKCFSLAVVLSSNDGHRPPPTHVIRQTTLLHRVVVHGGPLFWERGISNEMKRISIVSVFVRRIRFAMSFLFSFAIKLKFFLIQRQREPIGGPIESEGSSGNNLLMASDAKL